MLVRATIAAAAVAATLGAHAEDGGLRAPLVSVYAEGHLPVETVSASVTNTYEDKAIMITSVEFAGQLPELRYFYHGVYGRIVKEGNRYRHSMKAQQLSRPVASCFLLPRQSASWKRPMRVLRTGYTANVRWREMSVSALSTNAWFRAERQAEDLMCSLFEPMSSGNQDVYRNMTAGRGRPPHVVVEGDLPERSAEVKATCTVRFRGRTSAGDPGRKGMPGGALEFSLRPIADSVVLAGDRVVWREYSLMDKAYRRTSVPIEQTTAVDFLFLCSRTGDKTVPSLLDPDTFGDIIDVKRPYTDMYYNPGITNVPLKVFPRILERAKERGTQVKLSRIDPNGLGRQHVLRLFPDRAERQVMEPIELECATDAAEEPRR